MYYDLIASLPHLPHFEQAERLPITPLRLERRLRRLRPEHLDQLSRARQLIAWRVERVTAQTDRGLAASYAKLMDSPLDPALRNFVACRLTQQTLLAALRRRYSGQGLPEESNSWGVGPRMHQIRGRWEAAYFGLEHVYPWLPQMAERLSAADAIGLERLLVDLNWRWLSRRAEQSMFGFVSVMAFAFKWDMLRAWLECDPNRAKVRFTELIDKVTHGEHS